MVIRSIDQVCPETEEPEKDVCFTNSYPGIHVFKADGSLQYFTKESILKDVLGSANYDIFLAAERMPNMRSLFYLISILPKESASFCKAVLDRDNYEWKITVHDVLMIFLNWGSTISTLGLEDIYSPSHEIFSSQLSSGEQLLSHDNGKQSPLPHNIRLVMTAIEQRLPVDLDIVGPILIKLLVYGALDNTQRYNTQYFTATLRVILESFSDWSEQKGIEIISELKLENMDIRNAVHVVCCLFYMIDDRMTSLGCLGSHSLLIHLYGIHKEPSFTDLATELYKLIPNLLERFTFKQLYHVGELVQNIVDRSTFSSHPTPDHLKSLKTIYSWTVEVSNVLKRFPYFYNNESGHVRELLTRIAAHCIGVMRQVFKYDHFDDSTQH